MVEDSVALRVTMRCAARDGRVPSGFVVFDRAARAALLLDLALSDRIRFDSEQGVVDTTPTGSAAADALLEYIGDHPDRPARAVLARAPVTMLDVARPHAVAVRAWPRQSAVLDAGAVADNRRVLDVAASTGAAGSVAIAAATLLSGALNLLATDCHAALLGLCGPVTELVADCAGHITQVMYKASLIAGAGSGNGG